MIRALRTHHLGFSVADLRVASELVEGLGFEEVARSNLGGADMARGNSLPRASAGMVLLRRGSLLIELLEFDEKAPPAVPNAPAARVRLPVPNSMRVNSALRHVIGELAPDGAESATPPPMFENAGLPIVLSEADGDDRLRPTLDGGGAPPPPNRVGRLHVAIEVSAIEEACGHLEAAGFGFKSRPIRSAGPIWWTFLREPLGAGVELVDLSS